MQHLKFAILSTRYYRHEIVDPLEHSCHAELLSKGVQRDNIFTSQVPGAYELPFAASRLLQTHKDLDAIIVIACMIKGATMSYEFISEAVTMGIMKLNVKYDTPVILGLLTCANENDAKRCAAGAGTCHNVPCNHGIEWAHSALELSSLKSSLTQ